jgi:Ni2+-binding GTPase involved in maturation of urease and hydrogenase
MKPPFQLIIVGKPSSGKTNLLINLLLHPQMYQGVFDVIYVCSPTIDDTSKWSVLHSLPVAMKTNHYSESWMNQVVADWTKRKKRDPSIHGICIMDDI